MKISNLARSAAADAVVDLLDAGTPPGTLPIRTGAAPTNTTDADSGTLLATLTFANAAFGAASSGVATAAAIVSDTNVDNSGTAGHFRAKNAAGTTIFQGTCGQGSGEINWDNAVFVAGGTAAVSSMTYTQPSGS